MSSPPRGWAALQSALLYEVKSFNKKTGLRHEIQTRVTKLSGESVFEQVHQRGPEVSDTPLPARAPFKLALGSMRAARLL